MIQSNDKAGKIDIAIARYKQGRCPGCGKSQGETRGLEYRVRSRDLYCHTCRRRWPVEIDPVTLGDELCDPETASADILSLPAYDVSIPTGEPDQRQNGLRRLVRLFHRIVLK